MGDVVNLNKFRKRKARAERVKQADVNRRLHGRTKSERANDTLQKQQLTRHLDGKKLESPTQPESSNDDDPPPSSDS